MNNLGTVLRHLANLSIGNLLQNISLLDNTRVSSHDTLNVGIDFHKISLECSAQCSSGSVAATAAQGRKFIVVLRHTLEAADNRNDTCLAAGERHSVDAEFLQGCRHYAGGNDFAAAHHHIHLTHINGKVNILQCADKSIGCIGSALASHS